MHKALIRTGLATEVNASFDYSEEASGITPFAILSDGQDPEKVAAALDAVLAKRLFGDWKAEGPAPTLPKTRAGAAQPPRTIVVDLPGAGQAAVLAAVRGVSRSSADHPSLLLANSVLGGGSYGRRQETGGGYGAIVAGLILQGLQPADALADAARLAAVTPEAANAIAATNVTPENASLIVVGDSAKFIDKLRTLRPDLVVIPASELDLESPTLGATP